MTGPQSLPNVDFSIVPEWLDAGLWLVIDIGAKPQRILGCATRLEDAMKVAGVESSEPNIIVTKVPSGLARV